MKVIFPTDEHHPYADEKALSVARQIGKDFDPDLRIAGSDGMDFYALSKFNKDPGRMKAGGLQREIDVWVASQRSWIDATPNARVMYIAGNHEDRLRSWLWRHPEVHGLEALALPNLLLFDQLGIEMADNDEVILNGLILKHGSVVAGNSAYSARGELEREHFKLHTITGHTHRGGTTYATSRGVTVVGTEGFCLCSLTPEYIKNPDWQLGMVLAEVTPSSSPSIKPVPFFYLRGRVVAHWRGKEYISN